MTNWSHLVRNRDEWMHARCLFVCIQSHFSTLIAPRNHSAGSGAADSGLGLPTSINLAIDTLKAQLTEHLSLRLSFQVFSGCVKLTIKTHHDTYHTVSKNDIFENVF